MNEKYENERPFPTYRMDLIYAPTSDKELINAFDVLYRWIAYERRQFTDVVEYERWKQNIIKTLEIEPGNL
jgi:hypothetical protein